MGRKSKKSQNVFSVFFNSVRIYFLYLDKFVKYLLFPVFGQILGLIALFTVVYFVNTNVNLLQEKFPVFQEEQNILILNLCLILPFLIVSLKAFYDYIIAFSSLNTVCYTLLAKKKVKEIDFYSHDKNIERRIFPYMVLLLFVSIISIILILPPIIFVAPVLFIYLILIFQVFALEQNSNPISTIQRSIALVKGHFWKTIFLLLLVVGFSYFLIPCLILWSFNYFGWTFHLITPVERFVSLLPINLFNDLLAQIPAMSLSITELEIAKTIVEAIITSIFIMFMLPLRCCAFTNLYSIYDNENIKNNASEEVSEDENNG